MMVVGPMMVALTWLACEQEPAPTTASLEVVGDATLTLADQQAGRERRRMNIDQLSRAIETATGRRWTEDGEDLFVRLSGSLGKPDYLDSTDEVLAPGLLFQKFLSDAANQVCRDLMDEEVGQDPQARRLAHGVDLMAWPAANDEATTAALQRALLLFHGRELDAEHEELLAWRWLLDEATASSGSAVTGWRTVCVGLITHPDFTSL
jgi:hypothetical protein